MLASPSQMWNHVTPTSSMKFWESSMVSSIFIIMYLSGMSQCTEITNLCKASLIRNLANAPLRLAQILLCTQKYNLIVEYHLAAVVHIANAYSRAFTLISQNTLSDVTIDVHELDKFLCLPYLLIGNLSCHFSGSNSACPH